MSKTPQTSRGITDVAPDLATLADVRKSKKAALAIAEVARLLELDPRTVSAAAAAGDIPSVRVGRRVLIPREPLLSLLDGTFEGKLS